MKKGGKKVTKAIVTVEGLVEQGNNAISKLQPELAVKFFQRARALRPDDTNVLDALADVHLQLGDQEEALELLLMSTSLAPEANPFKWLYLAQLQNGLDSVATYSKAISILEALLQAESGDIDVSYAVTTSRHRKIRLSKLFKC
jgi:tetratricopeptide (TPR) repeat protein